MPKSKEIKNLKDPFVETALSLKQYGDAIKVINAVISLEDIGIEMQRKVIDSMIWNITGRAGGPNGKYLTRYRSIEAMENPDSVLVHEHVYKRKNLTQEIIAEKGISPKIRERLIGCVVTKEEHEKLHSLGSEYDGWERYEKAEITIKDMLTDEIVKINKGSITN